LSQIVSEIQCLGVGTYKVAMWVGTLLNWDTGFYLALYPLSAMILNLLSYFISTKVEMGPLLGLGAVGSLQSSPLVSLSSSSPTPYSPLPFLKSFYSHEGLDVVPLTTLECPFLPNQRSDSVACD